MKFFLISIVLVGLTFSCKKERLKKFDGVDYPTYAQKFDVNDNGIVGFELLFAQVSSKDIPVSKSVITGRLDESREGMIVLPHMSGPAFKLAIGDTLKRPLGPITLEYYETNIVSRNWDGVRWDAEYTIDAEIPNTYILGYILNDGSAEDLGWVRFDINPADANITVLEAKYTSGDFIVIE